MANKAQKPAEVQKKKIFCLRLDETYMAVLQNVLVMRQNMLTNHYLSAPFGERLRIADELERVSFLNTRFTHAMEHAEIPRRTGLTSLDRVIMTEFNKYKRTQHGLTAERPVSEPRTRRR